MNTARQESKLIAPKMAITEESVRLPNRLLILPWGESSYDGGTHKLIVNEAAISRIKEAQAASNFDKLALDFNHNSIPGSESYSGEPVKVAAYGVLEIVPNVGIYLANLEWTEDGINAWRGRHYKDISPAVLPTIPESFALSTARLYAVTVVCRDWKHSMRIFLNSNQR